jgi:hypothetical protein
MAIEETEIKLEGPFRRNAGLLGAIGLMFLVSPLISRSLADYRAVVLAVDGDRILVAEVSRPARWVSQGSAKPGDIVVKNMGAWTVKTVPPTGGDRELSALFHRYSQTYEGVITEIRAPLAPGSAQVAVVKLDDSGQEIHIPLWSEKLAGAAPGRRILKQSGSWDPILVEMNAL